MEPRRHDSLSTFILASLALHLLLVLALPHLKMPALGTARNEVEVLLETGRVIADILPPKIQKRPERSRFLGNYDSAVPEEEVASTPPQPDRETGKRGEPAALPPVPSRKETDPGMIAAIAPDPSLKRARRSSPLGDGGAGEGLSPQEDFFPDYKIGKHTYLNVQAHPDVGYFVRLKKVFRTTFNPVPALASYFAVNRVTRGRIEVVVAITLDARGNLEELFVVQDSGIRNYNEEVLRTVRDSAPFAAPPPKLMADDERLRMAWAFTVYL